MNKSNMKSFKEYRTTKIVVESTVPYHLHHTVDGWEHQSDVSPETHEKMRSALDKGSFTSFPLVASSAQEIDPDVAEHLTKHNYHITDYGKGLATIKKQVGDPERGIPLREKIIEEKIGKVLDRTGAPPDIKKAFESDPSRKSTKFIPGGGHHVVIATSPLAIAGMSTGTSWKNQSCMNMEGGSMNYKLEADSRHGTHVAFLVPHDDEGALKHGEPDKPIARIALKAYHEEHKNPNSDTIYRPETHIYGDGNTSFLNAVSQWSTKHYPAKAGVTYFKNPELYDDSHNPRYTAKTPKNMEDSIDNNESFVRKPGDSLDNSAIDHALSYARKKFENLPQEDQFKAGNAAMKSKFVSNMADVGNLNSQHVAALHRIIGEPSEWVDDPVKHDQAKLALRDLALQHGDKFSTKAINQYHEHVNPSTPSKMLMNPKLQPERIDRVDPSYYSFVRRSLLKPHHYDKLTDDVVNQDISTNAVALHLNYLSKENIDKIVSAPDRNPGSGLAMYNTHPGFSVIGSQHFTQEHHDQLVAIGKRGAGSEAKRRLLMHSKFAKPADVETMNLADYTPLFNNDHLSTDSQKELKDKFVASAISSPRPAWRGQRNSIEGFANKVPESISKHFTPEDYDKLAKSGKHISLASPEHSMRLLDTKMEHINDADTKLSSHIANKTDEEEDYDPEDDEHVQKLHEKLHSQIEHHSKLLNQHIDNHVADGNGDQETVQNYKHFDKMLDHLDTLDKLDNYKTEENSNRYDDTDHYERHILPIKDRLTQLHDNTEYRNNHEEW